MKNVWLLIQRLHGFFVKAASALQSPLLLVIRLYWGSQLAMNGWGKLHNLAHVTEFFTSLNMPAPHATAVFIALVEFLGGILLGIGLLARPVALVIAIDMMMAYIIADREALFSFFSDPGAFAKADPYTFLFAALLVLIFGAGKLSADTILGRITGKRGAIGAASSDR